MEYENRPVDLEYYSDETVTLQSNKAVEFLQNIFDDDLQQIDYLNVRQIGKEIQQQQTMKIEDTYKRPMYTEIVSRYIFDCYGEDIGIIKDLARDWKKTKEHLRELRKNYLNE